MDLGARTLKVRRRYYRGRVAPPKSKYGLRTLRLSPVLARQLWLRWADERPAGDDLVFTSERGERVDQSNLASRTLKVAAVAAGLGEMVDDGRGGRRPESWVSYHTFRHTCATRLFRGGFNAVQVQRWLGHHKPSFTLDVYVHLIDEDTPDPAFLDAATVGNTWATRAAEMSRDDDAPSAAEVAI